MRKFILLILSILSILSILLAAFLIAIEWRAPERFGSDWGNTFVGPLLWNGWNYGSAPDRVAPAPEIM